MTIRELIMALIWFDEGMTVYVPDVDGTAQIAKQVVRLVHTDIPIDGVTIPDDVAIIPQSLTVPETNEPPDDTIRPIPV